MTLSLSYDSTLARVRITATGLDAATFANVERSTDQITWTTVRGGIDRPISAGVMQPLDDYEFIDSVPNYYRLTYVDTITYVASGTAAHANNATVAPGIPTGSTAGDLMILFAATRQSSLGTPSPAPTGWTQLIDAGNVIIYSKIHSGSESSPTVNITGGGANMSVSAQIATFRATQPIDTVLGANDQQTNSSNQHIPSIGLQPTYDNSVIIWFGWKRDDWTNTSVPGAPVVTKIGDPSTTLGDDQGISWGYLIETDATFVGNAAFLISGGAPEISRSITAEFRAASLIETSSITPVLDGVWLKSLGRPFLNRKLNCVGRVNQIQRRARTIAYDIVGQSLPVAVPELTESRRTSVSVTTETTQEHVDMNILLGTGDPLFFHTPTEYPLPTMYVIVEDSDEQRPVLNRLCDVDYRRFDLPLREVAAPGASVVGSTGTWQTVIDNYDTWQEVIDTFATWIDLLELVGSSGEVIVG